MVMLFCGLRRGEALALTQNDFDFVNNILHVSKSVAYIDGKPQIKEPKTKAGIRDVPMPNKLRDNTGLRQKFRRYLPVSLFDVYHDQVVFQAFLGGYFGQSERLRRRVRIQNKR